MMVSMYRRLGRTSIEIDKKALSLFVWGRCRVGIIQAGRKNDK